MEYFKTDKLSVGYQKHVLIHDIDISVEKGKILTLIGPNGAGKSTILKTITRHLEKLGGSVCVAGQDIHTYTRKDMARNISVVLTDRIRTELTTCREVVAMGRYPYTNVLGTLTDEDKAAVERAMDCVQASELADQDFMTLSDGQRQRIMLAKAICQDTDIIVLDEPTAYLDIRHKIGILNILRKMAYEEGRTVIMSLHEIDLATKISDYLILVKGDRIAGFGTPDEVVTDDTISRLYDITDGSYDRLFGSVELVKPQGKAKTLIVGGMGCGIPVYREMQKHRIPFAAGILFENDVDYPVARELAEKVFLTPAFEPVSRSVTDAAAQYLNEVKAVIDAGAPIREFNACNGELISLAKDRGIPVYKGWKEYADAEI